MTHLMQEIQLGTDASEREKYDNLGEVFAVILAMEQVEKAYSQGAIQYEAYITNVTELLGQFKSLWLLVGNSYTKVDQFLRDFSLDAPLAQQAIRTNRPTNKKVKTNQGKQVGDITSLYITFINYLELGMTSVADLIEPLDNLNFLIGNFDIDKNNEAVTLVKKWYDILKSMDAMESLSEEQALKVKIDVQAAHTAFDRELAQDG